MGFKLSGDDGFGLAIVVVGRKVDSLHIGVELVGVSYLDRYVAGLGARGGYYIIIDFEVYWLIVDGDR